MTLPMMCSRFAALSDPLRLRLMLLLHREGELCVCEMTQALGIPQPKASKHLSVLRDAGLVRIRRDAQWVHYSTVADSDLWLEAVLSAAIRDDEAGADLAQDRRRLVRIIDRAGRRRAA